MSLSQFPLQSAGITYGASTFWDQLQDDVPAGVEGLSDFRVQQRGAGANMSCDVNVGANGKAVGYVPFAFGGIMYGLRRVSMSVLSNSGTPGSVNAADWIATFVASDPTNPRIDSVYLVCRDSTIDATGAQDAKLQVVTGTPGAGNTLDNRTGAGAAPANSLLLADILIPAAAATVTTANIRDRRPLGPAVAPPLFSAVDAVQMQPLLGYQVGVGAFLGVTNAQAAAAMYLPRRIVLATRVRWGYKQTATPTTGSWNIAICDASGRPIVATGATAFSGIANANVQGSTAITATTFEAGVYYVLYGQVLTAGASVIVNCANHQTVSPVSGPNLFAYLAAATGTTFPAAINGSAGALTDASATPAPVQYGVPMIELSVG
jgi:hypothetical protein